MTDDTGVEEVIGIDSERYHVDRLLQAASEKCLAVRRARHPHFIHLVRLADPFGRKAVDLQHGEPDLPPTARAIHVVALGIDDGNERARPQTPVAYQAQQVIVGDRRFHPEHALVFDPHSVSVERVQEFAATRGVAAGTLTTDCHRSWRL